MSRSSPEQTTPGGPTFKVMEHRGEFVDVEGLGALVTATVHPSSILRAPDDASRQTETASFVRDLTAVRRALGARTGG